MPDIESKACRKCGDVLPLTEFSKARNACKPCERLRKADYMDRTREHWRERSKVRYWENPEKAREQAREWAASHREERQRTKRGWAKRNPEKHKAIKRRDYEKHKAQYVARASANRKPRTEKDRERQRLYRKTNPEATKAYGQRRRKLMIENGGARLSPREWLEILEYHDHRCAYCLERCEDLDIEHVVALSRGGCHDATNIVPACRACNLRKNSKPVFFMCNAGTF